MNIDNVLYNLSVVVVIALLYLLLKSREKAEGSYYDERQIIMRGNAYRRAFMTALFTALLISFTLSAEVITLNLAAQLVIWPSLAVFSCSCILSNSYRNDRKERTFNLSPTFFFVFYGFRFLSALREHRLIAEGRLTDEWTPLLISLFGLSVMISTVAAVLRNKAEAEEE